MAIRRSLPFFYPGKLALNIRFVAKDFFCLPQLTPFLPFCQSSRRRAIYLMDCAVVDLYFFFSLSRFVPDPVTAIGAIQPGGHRATRAAAVSDHCQGSASAQIFSRSCGTCGRFGAQYQPRTVAGVSLTINPRFTRFTDSTIG